MGQRQNWRELVNAMTDLQDENLYQSLVELAGDSRVLIEHHMGVTQYGTEKICVKVSYGRVTVTGNELELRHMSGVQLIVAGKITGILLERG